MSTPNATAAAPLSPIEQPCPHCQAAMPVHPGYITWCERCAWNLQPVRPPRPKNLFESLYAALGDRLSTGLFAELQARGDLAPRPTPALLLAYGVALLVHGLTLALLAAGLALLVQGWGTCVAVGLGVLALGLAWAVSPRFPRLDADEGAGLVARDTCPTWYGLVDEVATALGAPKIDLIVLTEQFNASIGKVGWRRQTVLSLGLPLLAILDDRERIALVGHEIAHTVNGDPARSFVVGTAIATLDRWYRLLHPGRLGDPRLGGVEWLATIIANFLLLGLAWVVRGLAIALTHLLWRNMQRAEYLADALGAQVSGTPAMLGLLDKLHLGPSLRLTQQRVALAGARLDLFAELAAQVAAVPPREKERIHRIERLAQSRLDTTHPPTPFRLDMLRAHPAREAAVAIPPARHDRLEAELRPARQRVQQVLVDNYTHSLYY